VTKGACPCGGDDYRACCRPFHQGAEPPDPGAMVRSRFSAFALGEGAYLWRTLHPEHELRARPEEDVVRELKKAHHEYRYRSVTVHEVEERGDRARVLFAARIFQKGRDRSFVELSSFERTREGWRYRDGVLLAASKVSEPTMVAFEALLARER
jgi:SEC-C motif-containing protein